MSSPNRSPLFVEEFKWEDLKVLQILPFCIADTARAWPSQLLYDLNCAPKLLGTNSSTWEKPTTQQGHVTTTAMTKVALYFECMQEIYGVFWNTEPNILIEKKLNMEGN